MKSHLECVIELIEMACCGGKIECVIKDYHIHVYKATRGNFFFKNFISVKNGAEKRTETRPEHIIIILRHLTNVRPALILV